MDDQQVTDCELIERIAQGDEDAFNTLHVRYKRRVMGFLYRRLSLGDQRRGLVEDLSQESWLRIYLSASQYRPEYNPAWWLYQQVKRAIQDKVEKQTAMKRDAPTYSLSQPIVGKDDGMRKPDRIALIRDERPRPDELLALAEQRQAITNAIAALPEKYRQPMCLNLQDWQYSRIAVEMEITAKEATARISYGRWMIKRQLQQPQA